MVSFKCIQNASVNTMHLCHHLTAHNIKHQRTDSILSKPLQNQISHISK